MSEDTSTPSTPESPATRPPGRMAPWVRIVLLLVAGAAFAAFHQIAVKRGEIFNTVNKEGGTVIFDHDQHAYLNAGRLMKRSGYEYVMPRYRTPGLPFLLSFAYEEKEAYTPKGPEDPRKVSDLYFTKGKHAVILLTMLSLVAVYFLARRWLPPLESFLFAWACMWLLYIFKAPYVRPEPTYYSVFFLGSLLTLNVLARPGWWDAIFAGALLAGAYLLKAAVLPLLLLFYTCFWMKTGARLIRLLWRRKSSPDAPPSPETAGRLWVDIAKAHAILLVFLGLLSPYLITTAKLHKGNPFWSMHSSVFMWTDSKNEIALWASRGITAESQDIPPEAPSARNYLKTHTSKQIFERCWFGIQDVLKRVRLEYQELHHFTFKRLMRCVIAALILSVLFFWRDIRRHWAETLFVLGFFGGFAAIAGWYQALQTGPRLILALYVPFVFLGFFLISRFGRTIGVPDWGFQFDLRRILLAVLIVSLSLSTWEVLSEDVWKVIGAQ